MRVRLRPADLHEAVRRTALAAMVMLILAFGVYSYIGNRELKKDLHAASMDLAVSRARLDQAAADRAALLDEVKSLQALVEDLGGSVPEFTLPESNPPTGSGTSPGRRTATTSPAFRSPGPSGPGGPPGPQGPPGGPGSPTPRPPDTTSTTSTTSTTAPPAPITLPTIPPLPGRP